MSVLFQKKSFRGLVVTHFCTVLNDNLYKVLLVLFLLGRKDLSQHAFILSSVSFLFVLPFIVLAAVSGSLADKYSKRKLILLTRIAEIVCTSLGCLGFYMKSQLIGYTTLILMATHSAVFGPAKFGILPEISPREKMTKCNGLMVTVTYVASVLGTALAFGLAQSFSNNFVAVSFFCVSFSVIGLILSLQIKETGFHNPEQRINWFFIKDVMVCLKRCKTIRFLISSILLGGFFLFIGSYVQLALIPFVQMEMGYRAVYGGYLFIISALGIGVGSVWIGYIVGKKISLGSVPLAGLGIALALIVIFLFSGNIWIVGSALIFLGFCGGCFIVPLHAFVQVVSPEAFRGQNLATSNLVEFVGILCASGAMFFLGHILQLSPKTGFLIIGFVALLLSVSLLTVWKEQVILFYKIIKK